MILPNLPSYRRFNKVISLLVAVSFIFSNIAFADIPKTSALDTKKETQVTTDPTKIIVPRDYGLIKSRYNGKEAKKLIIHIQDAHCNYEAQSNIIKILECLIKNDDLRLISVEGADGFIDTSWFKAFPDADIRKEVADYFMKKGEITGPEFLSITSDYPIKLFGAETRSYYIENLNAFTTSYPLKEDTEKYLNQIRAVINKLKGYIYNDELREFDSKSQDYESKKLSFTDYVKYLELLGTRHKVPLRQYDNLFKLVSVLIYEKKIDFNVVDKERAALIDAITKKIDKEKLTELVNKSLEFKVGKISSAEYYDYLRTTATKHGIQLSNEYPNLFNYIIYNSVYSRIENEQLFNDIKKFEGAIKEKIFINDDQRTLERLSRHINTLIGLVNIKLLNDDFDYYKAHKEEFTHEAFANFINKMASRYGFAYEIDEPSEAVRESMPKLEEFYSIAIKRDKALVDNTLQAMKKEGVPVSVLVTGGFHSEGISKLLEKQGISYVVVCPNITKDVETPYIKILTNQRTPLEEILTDTSATTADAKNVKSGMLAPYLMSAARVNIGGLRNIKEIGPRVQTLLDEWAEQSIRRWFPAAQAALSKRMGLEPDHRILSAQFGIDLNNDVEADIKAMGPTKEEVSALRANARHIAKNIAPGIIERLLKAMAQQTPAAISRAEAYSSPEKFAAYAEERIKDLLAAIPELEQMMADYREWKKREIEPLELEFSGMEKDKSAELRQKIDKMKKEKSQPIENLIRDKYNFKIAEKTVGAPLESVDEGQVVKDIPNLPAFMKSPEYLKYLAKARELRFGSGRARIDVWGGAASRLFGEGQERDTSLSYASHDIYDVAISNGFDRGKLEAEHAIFGLSVATRAMIQKFLNTEEEIRRYYKNLGINKSDEEIERERDQIISMTPRIVIINDENGRSIINEFLKNNFYGAQPQLVVFVVQSAYHGWEIVGGKPVLNRNSTFTPGGHGDATMQVVQNGRGFTVDRDWHVKMLEEDAVTYLMKQTKNAIKIFIQSRVNDMMKLGSSAAEHPELTVNEIDMGIFSLALAQMGDLESLDEGHNVILEQVGQDKDHPIKGGSPLNMAGKKFLVEGLAQSSKIAELVSKKGVPFNRFFIFYKPSALTKILKSNGLPMYFRFRDGYIYPETVTGDVTMLDGMNAGYALEPTRQINDYKDTAGLRNGVSAAQLQDKNPTFRRYAEMFLKIKEESTRKGIGLSDAEAAKAPGLVKRNAIGAIRAKGGEVTAAEHGTRLKGHSAYARRRLELIRSENSINGIIGRLVDNGSHPVAISLQGVRLPSDTQIPALQTYKGDNRLEELEERLKPLGINFILIKGLKDELAKAGMAQDLILHYGVTRRSAYMDEDDFNYLFSLPNGVDIIVEGAIHEKAHIDNELANLENPSVKLLSEEEIEKIAPNYNVRMALAMRNIKDKNAKVNIISAEELKIKRVFGTNGIRSDDIGEEAQRRIAAGTAEILKAQWEKANPGKELPWLMVGFDPRPQGVNGFKPGEVGESKAVAETLAAYGFKVLFIPRPVAAPFMISMTGKGVHPKGVYASVMRTASHNEVVDSKSGRLVSGVKLFIDNAPASDAVTGLISERINNKDLARIAPGVEFDKAVADGRIVIIRDGDENDPDTIEFNRLSHTFNLAKMGATFRGLYPDLKIAINTMNGGMSGFALRVFEAMGFKEGRDFRAFNTTLMNDQSMEAKMMGWVEYTDLVSGEHKKVRFAPDPTRLWMRGKDYTDYVASDPEHIIALLIDGDADRLVAELKEEITPNDIGMLAAYYLAKYRGQTGRIVRTVPTTGGLDALSKALGLGEVQVTPVGSKWFAGPNKYYNGTLNDILVAVEESGHIAFVKEDRVSHKKELFFDHSIGLSLLMLEIMVVTGKTWQELSHEMWMFIKEKTGQYKIAAVRYGISKDEGAEKYYDLVARLGNPKEDEFRKEFGSRLEEELAESGFPWKVVGFDITDAGGAQFKFMHGRKLFPRKSGTDGSVRLYVEVLEQNKAPELVNIMRKVMDSFITAVVTQVNSIDVDVINTAKALGIETGAVQNAIKASINKVMLLNDFAESVGIKKDKALENMVKAGIATIVDVKQGTYELTNDFFAAAKLNEFVRLQIASSDNPAMVDLTVLRIERIIMNSVDVGRFVATLSVGKASDSVAARLLNANIFPTLMATWNLARASQAAAPGATVTLAAEDVSIPQAAGFYQNNGVKVDLSVPSNTSVNEEILVALQNYQAVMGADMARGGYNYRGTGTKQTVEQFFNDYFMKEWYEKIRSFVRDRFNKEEPLAAIVTNGIGANDQFMWSLANMYNANKPAGAPTWYHVTTAREFAWLVSEGKLRPANSLFIDISRSGGTWEGVEIGIRSVDLGFNKRIAIANGGAVKAIAMEAARRGGYQPLVIGMSPDIGGRNMHRKTTIYYTAQTIAGMFLPSLDSTKFAALHHQFDKANDFGIPENSLSVSTGRFLQGAMRLLGTEHIAFIANTEPLRLVGTEWEQYIMEGSNKEDIISMGIHDLTKEPEYVLQNLANSPAGKISIGMAVLDKASPTYEQDLTRVNALKNNMPLMVFTIDSQKAAAEGFKGGISPAQQAAFDILWTDMVTVFTTLLRVDANSNPNVKLVREYTAQRVAKWEEAQAAYDKDAIARGEGEVLFSYGSPAESKIGSEGNQAVMTEVNAAANGRALAIEFAKKGLLAGRNRLNLFAGREDLMGLAAELRNDAYASNLGTEAGWITQTALFPIWSHKGLEANLAYSADDGKPLLANRTLNIFFNARRLGPADINNQKFDDLGLTVKDKRLYEGINGATIHQTNDAMTIPNIKRMAEVSPTILFEFNEKTENVEAILKAFYGAFIEELAQEVAPKAAKIETTVTAGPSTTFDHTVPAIMQSSNTGERVRKTAETAAKEDGNVLAKTHLIFVKNAIPAGQLATTTIINLTNFCEDYYNELEGYTAHVADSPEKALELLAKNPDWDKTNTIVGLIDRAALDNMSQALKKSKMTGKTKLLAMEKFSEDQFIPVKGFFDLMATLVRVNKALDKDKDRELIDGIRDLLNEIGVKDVESLVNALSASAYFEDPIKFAKNFIIRLLPPVRPRDTKELKQLYDAAKKVVESL